MDKPKTLEEERENFIKLVEDAKANLYRLEGALMFINQKIGEQN